MATTGKKRRSRKAISPFQEAWSDQRIRDRAMALAAAGHQTSRGRRSLDSKPTVLQSLTLETGLSVVVLKRILGGTRTRGGKLKRVIAPTRGSTPSMNKLMGQAVATAASERSRVVASPAPASRRSPEDDATVAMLRQGLIDSEARNADLQEELMLLRAAADPVKQSRLSTPTNVRPWNARQELLDWRETAEAIVRDTTTGQRMRLILQHFLAEIDRP